MGVSKSGSKSFFNHHFLTLRFFLNKLPESENGGLEPSLSLKPPFKGFFHSITNGGKVFGLTLTIQQNRILNLSMFTSTSSCL